MGRTSAVVDRARRRIDSDLRRTIADLAQARRQSGLSLRTIALACGVGKSTIARIESGWTRTVDVRLLAAMGAAVGLDVRLRAYPSGDPLRDAGQLRLIERLWPRLHANLGWQTEVALPELGDLRAWDAVVRGDGWQLAVEAETVLDDLQATERRIRLKIRDGQVDHVLLLVADTRRNRRALPGALGPFAGFSREARVVLRALAAGEDPDTSSIVLM